MHSHLFANFAFVWTSHPRYAATSGRRCSPFVQSVVVAERL